MASKARKQAVGMMVVCSSLWSIAGILIKLIPWNPLVITGLRSLLAAVVMAVFMRYTHLKVKIDRYSIASGVFMCATMVSFVLSNKLTTAANAIVLEYTSPAFILIFSALFFRQKFHRADLITVLATMFGISLFFFDKLSGGKLPGNLISIFSGMCVAITYILSGKADTDSRMSGILFGHLAAAAIGVPMIFFTPMQITGTAVASILTLGIVQLGIPYVLYGLALKNCPPLACSLIGAIEPLLNPVWVFLFAGEAPGAFSLFGGAIVIISVTGWCVWRDRFVAAHASAT
jgi:drug/metabolite transporter (DMT)-like permease